MEQSSWVVDGDPGAPAHSRRMSIDVYETDEGFEAVGRITDERPWADGVSRVRHVHDLELRLAVDREGLVITRAAAFMHTFPHHECRDILPKFDQGLVGLSVARGYTRSVQERFGRAAGCSHLEFLARAMGPAIIQAIPSSASRRIEPGALAGSIVGSNWLANTCHLWAEDGGVGLQKVREGWRPSGGIDGYPAPSLVEIRQRRAEGEPVAGSAPGSPPEA